MRILLRILAALYGLQVIVVLPWLLGAISRGHLPLWAWDGYTQDLARSGPADALFLLYLYVILYSALLLIPYWLLGIRYRAPSGHPYALVFRIWRALLGAWFLLTVFLLLEPVTAFFRALPDTWNGWLVIGWCASVVVVYRLVVVLEGRLRSLSHAGQPDEQ
jgi:hypothetical protein